MEILNSIRSKLEGVKTYIVAFLIILIAVSEGLLGFDIPGVDVGTDWLGWMLNGLGLGTLRAGISKANGGAT